MAGPWRGVGVGAGAVLVLFVPSPHTARVTAAPGCGPHLVRAAGWAMTALGRFHGGRLVLVADPPWAPAAPPGGLAPPVPPADPAPGAARGAAPGATSDATSGAACVVGALGAAGGVGAVGVVGAVEWQECLAVVMAVEDAAAGGHRGQGAPAGGLVDRVLRAPRHLAAATGLDLATR